MKTNLYLLLYLLLSPLLLQAQNQTGRGQVSGTLVEGQQNNPVGYANVVLLTARDSSLVTGSMTDVAGYFELKGVPNGQFILRATMIGYPAKYVSNISITPENQQVQLQNVRLAASTTRLSEVQVVTERPMVEYELDKKVVNIQQNITAQGGSVADAMQNVPSVNVDIDGNVSLRGSSNVTILVNGKRSALANLTLDQIPASMIESVELITNPSAKFDPEGTGGVINLILKKEKKPGFNGIATVNVGTYENYNGSLNLNYRYNKWSLNGGYDFRRSNRPGERDRFTTYYPNTDSTYFLEQLSDNKRQDLSHSFRFGADYYLTDNTTLSASALYRTGEDEDTEDLLTRQLNANRQLVSTSTRDALELENDQVLDYTLGYRRTFAQKGRELTADLSYTSRTSDENSLFTQMGTEPVPTAASYERTLSDDETQRTTVRADYIHPISEDSRFEAGFRSSFERLDNDFRFLTRASDASPWLLDEGSTNRFMYDEDVHALYSNYNNKIGDFSFQLGLRAEQTFTTSDQRTQDQVFDNDYFSLFPSVFLTQDFENDHKLQFSYSRRINRPRSRYLNPFIDRTDTLNVSVGNPRLLPEYINSLEFGYLKYWGSTSFTSTVFYRRTNDQIQRVREVRDNGVIYTTFANLTSGTSYGVELVGTYSPYKWWRLNGSVSGFKTELNDSGGDTELSNNQWSWTSKLNSTMTVWEDLSIQLSADYRAPMATLQGRMEEVFAADLGMKKDVLQGNGTVTLRLSDVFNTRRYNFESFDDNFIQESNNRRQSRMLYIGFTYRLNSEGRNGDRQRSDDNGGGPDEDMF